MAGRGWRWQNYGCLWMVARFSNAHNKHQKLDLDTLPSTRNILQIELFFEAMALNAIVEEIMKDDTTATVYANDGSSWSRVRSYIVQSLTMNGEQRPLPSFGIFKESRESLAELEATTLKILFAASFHRYSEKAYSTELIL